MSKRWNNYLFVFLIWGCVFLFGFPSIARAAWYNGSWTYRRAITIHNEYVDADISGFPVLVQVSSLSNINTNGTDIRFTSSDGVTELPREIESYSGGNLVAWVKTDLANSADTVIYMYYGNSGASEPAVDSTYGSRNVWTSSYLGVWHLKETGTNPTVNNSSSSSNNSSSQTWTPTAGKFGGGGSFNGSSNSIDFTSNAGLNPTAITVTAWTNADVNNKWQYAAVKNGQWNFGRDNAGKYYLAAWNISATNVTDAHAAATATTGAWEHIAFTYDGTSAKYFVNNSEVINDPVTGNLQSTTNVVSIGSQTGGNYWDGLIDEVRIASTARSSQWISTEYNNQNSPDTFATVGSESPNDTTAPTISTLSPADNSNTGNINGNLAITFSEAVTIGTGNVVIKKTADNSTVETIAITSGQVTGSGTSTITINPLKDLSGNTEYYVQIDATAIDDLMGNSFAGITDTTTWSFTTTNIYDSGWSYRKKLTISKTNVGTDLVGFPLFVRINADADIGDNTQNDGDDIRFTSSDGVTLLPYSKVSWSGGGGVDTTATYWLKTDLDHDANTDIYIYYGNSSAIDGQRATEVWDTNFKGVWHLDDNTTSTTVDDATDTNNGTARQNTSVITASGVTGSSLTFNGTTDYVAVPDSTAWDFGTGAFSTSMWFKKTGESRGDIFNKKSSDETDDFGIILEANEVMDVWLRVDNVGNMAVYGSTGFAMSQWHLATFTRDGSGNLTTYIDGTIDSTGSNTANMNNNNEPIWFGTNHDSSMNLTSQFAGSLDEVRISNTNRSASWIKFEYCNSLTTATGTCIGNNEIVYSTQELQVTPTPTPTPTSTPTSTTTTSSSTPSNSSVSAPSCNDSAPTGTPDLFQIDTEKDKVILHFTTVSGASGYQISYGPKESANDYGDSFDYSGPLWIIDRSIGSLSPNTDYYFKVKAVNGCNGGEYSKTLKSRTKGNSIVEKAIEKTEEIVQEAAQKAAEIPVVEKLVDKNIEVTKTEIKSKPNIISYIIQKGDSLWSIAKKFLGEGAKYKDIIALNKQNTPSLEVSPAVKEGMKLDIETPEVPAEETGYDLDIKVLADSGSPMVGVKVTLHSDPKESTTDQEGVAHFSGVETGKHQVFLAYKGYDGGGQAINVTGDNKNLELVMQIQLSEGFSSPRIIAVIGAMAAIIIGLLVALKIATKKRHTKNS